MPFGIFRRMNPRLLTAILLFAFVPGLAGACTMVMRRPGTPIDPPLAVAEGVVISVREAAIEYRPNRFTQGWEYLIEVVRSFHGSHLPGEHVTDQRHGAFSCTPVSARRGDHVLLEERAGAPGLTMVATRDARGLLPGPFAEIARIDGPWRTGSVPGSEDLKVRGDISDETALELFRLSRLDTRDDCEITAGADHAQVACGRSADSHDAATKVIFERDVGVWVEVMRMPPSRPADAATQSGSTIS